MIDATPSGTRPVAMTVAGSDSSGGAGVQADLRTFSRLGAFGTTVITALTAQNLDGVRNVHPVPLSHVRAQAEAVLDGFPVAAAKTGMLWSAGVVELVAGLCRGGRVRWWVVDPVMVARLAGVNTHGSGCMLAAAITALLARGLELPAACERGLDFVHAAMRRPHDVAGVARLAGIETAG